MVTTAVLGLPLVETAARVGVFMVGGVVKGATRVGLPLVPVPLATQFVPVPVAVALVSVSEEVASVVQPRKGGLGCRASDGCAPGSAQTGSRSWCCWCWRPAGSTCEEGAIVIVYWEGADDATL